MIDMRFGNADFDYRPATGLEKPASVSKANSAIDGEGDTGEWPAIHPENDHAHALSQQEITRKLIDACLQLDITLVTFDSSQLGKNGEISPDYMKSKLEAAFQSNCPYIIIDFSGARSFEETSENDAAGFLMKALRTAFRSNKKVIFCEVGTTIDGRLRALRIESLFSRAASVDAAIASIKPTSPPPTPSDHP